MVAEAINTEDNEKECPFCAEVIKKKAVKCRFCGSDLNAEKTKPKPKRKAAKKNQRLQKKQQRGPFMMTKLVIIINAHPVVLEMLNQKQE